MGRSTRLVAMVKPLGAVLLMLATLCEAKNVHGTFRLSASQWRVELGKFAFSKGLGHITGNFSTRGYPDYYRDANSPVKLVLFVDTQYSQAKEALTCDDFVSSSVATHSMTTHSNFQPSSQRLAGNFPPSITPLNDPPNKSFYIKQWDAIENRMRPHYWYLVAADCSLDQ